jgi:hypothetical protein
MQLRYANLTGTPLFYKRKSDKAHFYYTYRD